MKLVMYLALFAGGAITCYLLLSLGIFDIVDGIPGSMTEPAITMPTYLSFISVMMTAVTAVLAAVAIGIGVVAFFTYGGIKDEAKRMASKRVNEMIKEKLSDEAIKARIDEIAFQQAFQQGAKGELDEDFDPDDMGER